MGDQPGFQSDSAARQSVGRTTPPVRPLSSDQQPATKADLYAAVDAMRADMRELLDQISTLIKEANKK
ncbi:hypothetical protein F0Q45_00275 [Mycobacterium simiae]|uniref:Uncharacterized protein n=1 Tax=Mycobacterium simiae TaxID=1784 RepID=A0A5B1BW37_MYCSI|nr:hypothetical protein F0Q45_00275 [Mycobacterium simiae]